MMNEQQFKMIHEDCDKIIRGVGKEFEKLQGKTVLITGANGMLASFFVDTIAVLNDNYFQLPCNIIAMIRSELNVNSRIWHLRANKNINFIVQDVSKSFKICGEVDYIIHAASKASPKDYLSEPVDTINSNVNALKILLEYSMDNKIEGFLYFSSSEIYGTPDDTNIPTSENYEGKVLCTSSRACYTETKRFCETMLVNYSKEYNIPAKIVRPWHVFGLGMRLDDGRVIGDFIRDGLCNKDIQILSDGLSTRSFCYMTDAHIAFWKVIFCGLNAEAYNVGDDSREISIRDLADLTCNLFDNKIKYSYSKNKNIDYLKNSPQRCCPNIDKAKQYLNYEPTENLEEWLLRIIKWYKVGGK